MFESKTSEKQIKANQANAQKSTGPRTQEGKDKCKFNAFRHGLTGQVTVMTEEDREANNKFLKAYIADLDPEGMIQYHLARNIANSAWRLNRAQAHEENILAYDFEGMDGKITAEHPEIHAAVVQSLIFFNDPQKFVLLTLYEQRIHRAFHKDLKTFMDMTKNRPLRKPLAQPKTMAVGQVSDLPTSQAKPEATNKSTASAHNGSVFSNGPVTAETPAQEVDLPVKKVA